MDTFQEHVTQNCRGPDNRIVDAHRGDGKRLVVRADEILTAFLELESAIPACGDFHHHSSKSPAC
jgi:hypothetical protein